jgi:hypothetical protein
MIQHLHQKVISFVTPTPSGRQHKLDEFSVETIDHERKRVVVAFQNACCLELNKVIGQAELTITADGVYADFNLAPITSLAQEVLSAGLDNYCLHPSGVYTEQYSDSTILKDYRLQYLSLDIPNPLPLLAIKGWRVLNAYTQPWPMVIYIKASSEPGTEATIAVQQLDKSALVSTWYYRDGKFIQMHYGPDGPEPTKKNHQPTTQLQKVYYKRIQRAIRNLVNE